VDCAHPAQGAVVLPDSRVREHGVDPSGKTLGDLTPAAWTAALDRQTWDQVRAVLLIPDCNTNVRKATRYLLTGLIHCGSCGAAVFSRPRNNRRRYLALDVGLGTSWESSPIRSTSW
jgi:hypothetical protein